MRRRPAEAFTPGPHHYLRPAPAVAFIEAVRPVLDGLLPAGFANVAIDPHAVYPGLCSWDRRLVREARIRSWEGTSYDYLVKRERELLEAGL
ncbi:hypothetical protein [Luteibacter sp.]|uniref:hypothetical protein n=1 Tax=Luteibacter sp. TaxID=1886636 RepID=UPI003F7EA606